MKKRSLFAISLMSMALVACSNDEEVNKVIDPAGEGALVTLKLDVAKPQTKGSPSATNTQPGTEAENAISNVTVVVDYGTEQKYFTNTTNGATWDATNKKLSFKAPEGEATFYVYANTNNADPVGSSWKANWVSAGTVSDYYKASNFFMSNQDGKGITHTINATTDNAVSVNVERAAAKVTVESKASFTDNTYGGTMTDMSFTLGNMVDKFYLLQQSNYAIPTQLSYLPDGNAGTNAWVDVTLGKSVNGEDAVDATSLRGAYCMENVKNTYAQNNTTYAKFKTTFTPGKALDFEATTSDDVAGLVVKNELKDVTAPSDGETAPSFYVVLEGNEDLTSNYIMAKDITNKDGVTITPTTGGNTVTGIEGITKISSIYTNGQCYFGPIWFNIDETKSQSPVYRNDWYHLTVTKIKLPGSPQEPDPDTPDPLVPDVNVTVTATVLNWEWEPRNIELQ